MSAPKLCLILGLIACALGAASRSSNEGVFTKAQALRGRTVYREECAKCHGENLTGGEGAPGLVGDDFAKWANRSAFDFFERTRKTMPADDPGHLSRRQYADVVAYMLQANEYPAGDKDLESTEDELKNIRIEARKK